MANPRSEHLGPPGVDGEQIITGDGSILHRKRSGPAAPIPEEGPPRRFPINFGGTNSIFPSRREAARIQLEQIQLQQLQEQAEAQAKAALKEEILKTQETAVKVPNLSVAFINIKHGAKTTSAVHTALSYAPARDRTITIIDANNSGRVHERLGIHVETKFVETELVTTRKFASKVRAQDEDNVAVLLETLQKQREKEARGTSDATDINVVTKAQAKAVRGSYLKQVSELRDNRQSTTQGIGFIARSTSLSEGDALDVVNGVKAISNYNIYDTGNKLGDADSETDVRTFINAADLFVFTVDVGTRDSWQMLDETFQRLEDVCAKLPPKDAQALRKKRENSIIVISGLDPDMNQDQACNEFLQNTGMIQVDPIPQKNGNETKTQYKYSIGGYDWNGPAIIGVPWDEAITYDSDYSLDALQTPTRLAYQRVANAILEARKAQMALAA